MKFTLRIWRQPSARERGHLETFQANDVSPDMSFLEMLDEVNRDLIREGRDPIAFDSDCREGICGTCGVVLNGRAHGPQRATTLCELRMRAFHDGDELIVEPFRARAFPLVKDLAVDRSAFDRIIQAGGYVSVGTGAAPDANAIPVGKQDADRAMDAAQCIGCGACVAQCPNAAAMLFTSAKIGHLAVLPQGRVEWRKRARDMVAAMDAAGFGNCSNHTECEAVCPKEIKLGQIARMNRHFFGASILPRQVKARTD